MSKDPRRLGRGLASVVGSEAGMWASLDGTALAGVVGGAADTALASVARMVNLPVERIRVNPDQPRRHFSDASLGSLAESLKSAGTIQPIVVRPAGDGYELVTGERRLRASRLAGLAHIPAIIRTVADDRLLELALVENIHREDLNAVDRARAYRRLSEEYGLTHDEIAARMGEDRATVTNYIRLLSLPDEVLSAVADGRISQGQARALLLDKDNKSTLSVFSRVMAEDWSVRRIEAHFKGAAGKSPVKERSVEGARVPRPAVRDLEERLGLMLGVRVQIREGRRRHTGRVVIAYQSLDDFERIFRRLGAEPEAP